VLAKPAAWIYMAKLSIIIETRVMLFHMAVYERTHHYHMGRWKARYAPHVDRPTYLLQFDALSSQQRYRLPADPSLGSRLSHS